MTVKPKSKTWRPQAKWKSKWKKFREAESKWSHTDSHIQSHTDSQSDEFYSSSLNNLNYYVYYNNS